jgi:hypothetical protein
MSYKYQVFTSSFHGSKLISQHHTIKGAIRSALRHDCGTKSSDCRCGGTDVLCEGEDVNWREIHESEEELKSYAKMRGL